MALTSNIPVALFPLKIETRFVGTELWIRIFPDMVFIRSHNPILSGEEQDEIKEIKKLFTNFSIEQKRALWEDLVAKYGVYRATYILQIGKGVLSQNDTPTPEVDNDFYYKWLPDYFTYYLYKDGKIVEEETGRGIDRELLEILSENLEEEDWLSDFDKAIQVGLGIKIRIKPEDTHFDRVLVCGFRDAIKPKDTSNELAALFQNHQFTEGFSFLEYGTPTNNTNTAQSGYSAHDEYNAVDSFDYAVEGLEVENTTTYGDVRIPTAGKKLARLLGFSTDFLKYIQNADIKESPLNELFQKASWFALGGQSLLMLMGNQLDSSAYESLWEHYYKYVKGRGNYPAIKIGNQPYGIVPVMNIRKSEKEKKEEAQDIFLRDIRELCSRVMDRWEAMKTQVPTLWKEGDKNRALLKALSMQPYSTTYQIRALRYDDFQTKLNNWLQQLPKSARERDLLALNKPPFFTPFIQQKYQSLLVILTDFMEEEERLLQTPILSFLDDNQILGFRNKKTSKWKEGTEEELVEAEYIFSLIETDWTPFKDFIEKLDNAAPNELIYYEGKLNVFTDLFLKSFATASQLYYQQVAFLPSPSDLQKYPENMDVGVQAFLKLEIGTINQTVGSSIKAGDKVLEVIGTRTIGTDHSHIIPVVAPFDGIIKSIEVKKGEATTPKMPLFTLFNEEGYKRIKDQFINLGRQIVELTNNKGVHQEIALRESIDLNSFRVDAWITSLAARQIEELRNKEKSGIYFGAYGWVEDLERDQKEVDLTTLTDTYNTERTGGIIHTTDAAQAVAATIFKNSYLKYKESSNDSPYALNLTSDRIQKSNSFLEGIRQGQQVEALLGYQLERFLHEANLHNEIYALREAFPLYENISSTNGQATGFVNLSVINGLEIIEAKNTNEQLLKNQLNGSFKKVKGFVEKLEDILDGSLDTLFYEAGYQVTQGNLSQAAAALDATKGEIEPPPIESLKTKLPGVGIAHKLAIIFPKTTQTYSPENCRAFVEPVLENWISEQLGDFNKIGCQVQITNSINDTIVIHEVRLSDLQIGHLDFLYLSKFPVSDGASELEWRIWKYVQTQQTALPEEAQYNITDVAPNDCQALFKALEVARCLYDLLQRGRYLKSEDISRASENSPYDWEKLKTIKDRLNHIKKQLEPIAKQSNLTKQQLAFLAKLDLETAKVAFLSDTILNAEKLKAALNQKINQLDTLEEKFKNQLSLKSDYYVAFGTLQKIAKALFGNSFLLLPPAVTSTSFQQAINRKEQELLVGQSSGNANRVWGQERIHNWVQGVAQVEENMCYFEDWLMVNKVWNNAMQLTNSYEYHIVQSPTFFSFPWVGLSKEEIQTILQKHYADKEIYKDPDTGSSYGTKESFYPDGCESMVLYKPKAFFLNEKEPLTGLVIEEFSEHIPHETVDTSVSFHYNAPNTEAPQAILLAVHPKSSSNSKHIWTPEILRDILYDTMDLYKIRMIDPDALQDYGFLLPMSYWFNIPSKMK